MPQPTTRPTRFAAGPTLAVAALLAALGSTAKAATISEVFLSGPAGQALELTGVDDAQGATLAIHNGSRIDPNGFGQVLDIVHLPQGGGWNPVVLITDSAWPGGTVPTTLTDDVNLDPLRTTLNFGGTGFDRLFVVFDGATTLQLGDNPTRGGVAADRYDATAVTDWLALGPTGLAGAYDAQYTDLELAELNTALGIDLLTRTAERSAGSVFARTNAPGQPLDPDTTFVGNPDANGRFLVGPGLAYRTTPGVANVPLIEVLPEPGSATALVLGGLFLGRRRRRVV